MFAFSVHKAVLEKANNKFIFYGIPCVSPDGEVGLFDIVTQQFFGNAGTGKFIPSLPKGYSVVEYLQSDGNSYIDTEVAPENDEYSVEFEMKFANAGDMFFGCGDHWNNSNEGYYLALANNNGESRWGKGGAGANSVISAIGVTTNTFYKYKLNKTGLYINDSLKSSISNAVSYESSLTMRIFKPNLESYDGYGVRPSVFKYLKLFKNDIIKKYFIPCKNASNVPGMYDVIQHKFYTNGGSGSLTAGPVI